MRAFAALAVVLIHAGGAGLNQFGQLGKYLATIGGAGVYVFFVISGFSVANSYAHSSSYKDFLLERLIRIAPLYYFWLIAAASAVGLNYWGQVFNQRLGFYNWFMHLSFLGGLDYRVTNSIIGTEWTIHIEVFWYVLIPLLMRPILSIRLGVPISLVISFYVYLLAVYVEQLLPLPPTNAWIAVYWNPLPYLFSFCLGISAYKLRLAAIRPAPHNLAMTLVLIFTAGYALISAFAESVLINSYIFYSTVTFAIICLGSKENFLCRTIFTNRFTLFLGTISYGIYLSHFPIKEWLLNRTLIVPGTFSAFVAVACAAISISALTYIWIERPFSNWAKRQIFLTKPAGKTRQPGSNHPI